MLSEHLMSAADGGADIPIRINGPADGVGSELRVPPGVTVLSLRMAAGQDGDPFLRWAVNELAALLEALQALLLPNSEQLNLAVIVVSEPTNDPWERAAMEAALEAVRGAVHSLTLELGGTARLNVIACRPGGDIESVAAALRYIASPEGAYVAGSTFDLREVP